MENKKRIIGIDPGYDIVGWAVLDDGLKVENYGVIKTSPEDLLDDRLLQIHRSLVSIIEEFNPNSAAIEKLFFQKNVKTAVNVAKAVGVIALTFKLKGVEFTEYSPTEIKHSVTGYGKAPKDQIYFMMKKLLRLDEIEGPDDAADALAIAVCHQLSSKSLKIK